MKPNDKAIEAARKVVIQRATHNLFNPSFLFGVIEAALDAAYAAQFQSGDYAGLVKQLRFIDEDTLNIEPYSCEQLCKSAADALEAVLAERDDFAEQLALRSESGMAKDMQEIMSINNELVAERDALAARLAPVEDEELVEIAAREIAFAQGDVESPNSEFMDENWHCWEPESRAAIAAIRPHIEAAERQKWQKMLARMGAGTTKTGAVNE